ncbi:tubulin-like doman-containing protein [Roseiconus lacunae]|uniref:serine/threonine protein kinase n=1 Tax=Roseiconus lacunae TaxID=2605694 RepID=UPI003092D98D|nr:tubulin-like doman-containing protein [Stieleria sp. HD01]
MPTVTNHLIEAGYEPIEGYVLEKRLGQGGFGEVWQAVAPGGLKKAVKFVYGRHGERHASQELKSLERIRGIQHPFILTLERFEFIDGQLVIVTELADGTLEDTFRGHRKRGSCGVPRDVLLNYLRDAAEALDYLHQHYKLQHLDIKPGNLLMVGGRVKVADFGLLKDLGEADCSLVGGLTPIYAPPEVFDGRPSLHSDQYSLAVLYQEMLTSTRPFDGRTIAQLATQHVHNAPNLSPLPATDRPIVARALEKQPERRFESCADFVNKLVNPHGVVAVPTEPPPATVSADTSVVDLPQLTHQQQDTPGTQPTQTLVVALGGTGLDALNQIRSRVFDRGASSPLTLHSVLIDTDRDATQSAMLIDPTDQAKRPYIVTANLKTPQEYRTAGTQRLASISRRWIYNVPRNGQTGGMRPLGRLALLDHSQQVLETLANAVAELKDSVADSLGDQGQPQKNLPLKVYVVASLTGGTGSGMYFDVVYLLRHILDEQALESVSIVSLLTTNRFQGDPSRPIALHATKSALSEMEYYLQPGHGYPGDSGVGWPSVPAARTPLHDAYVIAPADRADERRVTETVVSYLWADATVCRHWFENGRELDTKTTTTPSLRTVGLAQIGEPSDRQAALLGPHHAKELLLTWLGNPKTSEAPATEFAKRIVRRCYLDTTPLRAVVEQWFAPDRSGRRSLLTEQLNSLDPSELHDDDRIHSCINHWLDHVIDGEHADLIADQSLQQVKRDLRLFLQDRRLDLSSTITALRLLKSHCDGLRQQFVAGENSPQTPSSSTNQASTNGRDAAYHRDALAKACDLGEMLLTRKARLVAIDIVNEIGTGLTELVEIYSDASARVVQGIQTLSNELDGQPNPWDDPNSPPESPRKTVLLRLHENCVASHLFTVIEAPNSTAIENWVAELKLESSDITRQCIKESTDTTQDRDFGPSCETTTSMLPNQAAASDTSGMDKTQTWTGSSVPNVMSVEAAIDVVRPTLMECGGKQRMYLICRDEHEKNELLSQMPESSREHVSTFVGGTDAPLLIHEGQQISLASILGWLDSLTGDDGKISRRLASRSDLDW